VDCCQVENECDMYRLQIPENASTLDTSQTPGTDECLVSFVSSSRFDLIAAQNPFFHLLLNCVVL
jgi:hypothetical protein